MKIPILNQYVEGPQKSFTKFNQWYQWRILGGAPATSL